MQTLRLNPSHKPVGEYYRALEQFKSLKVSHETAVRSAFQNLLEACSRQFSWTLVPEWPIKREQHRHALRADGAVVDQFRLVHGLWEAKDAGDDLRREVKRKFAAGYPAGNILFQAPERAILYQNDREVLDADLTNADELVKALAHFFEYTPPAYEQWTQAVDDFQREVPELGRALTELIERERKSNRRFREAFKDFYELCRQSVNPNLSEQAVEEMLIQHMLTERIFRGVFHNSDFTRRNVVAAEIEKVIDALTSQAFSREAFLRRFDHFYRALEQTAATIEDFAQKQEFLNTVYEKFFQGFSVKVADTHGIVYTPQPIVNFMVRSVEDILRREFGKSLSSAGVHILDPFTGTGNFIVRVMQEIKKSALPAKYRAELHCNEVMLLPYYIASMNIEHEFNELTNTYEAFQGICLVDTFELAEGGQTSLSFMTPENTARVERQKRTPITVVIGNPPYNVGQLNENDNNKNRKYKVMDGRVAETYARDSRATNKNSLSDPYVKAIRWASDRIGDEGIVALVTNSSFIDNLAFDGMRKNLAKDFASLYVIDLGGNVRKNPKLSGTTHNVFGIQVGVSINIFVRKHATEKARIYYARVDELWRKGEKYAYLEEKEHVGNVAWQELEPDAKGNWLTEGMRDEFETFVPMGLKENKDKANTEALFRTFGGGVKTNRDTWVYNFDQDSLAANIKRTIEAYNEQVYKWSRVARDKKRVDSFVTYDNDRIAWSRDLKLDLRKGRNAQFSLAKVRRALYRPFTKSFLFFDRVLNEEVYVFPSILPTPQAEQENYLIWLKVGSDWPMFGLMSNVITDLLPQGGSQCFPFYTYNEDGANRRENITDWALEKFRAQYADGAITKWDIFHYVYALLHHPLYRERYAANLKRELPRVPFAPDFHAFARAGARLAEIHVNYERADEYPLGRLEQKGVALDWRVERMRLSKDKRSLVYNEFLTLDGIPPEVYEYRLGNRSALEWVVDQYQVKIDKRSGITNDPNRADDPEYIVRLVGQVVAVSLETVKIVGELPALGLEPGRPR
ncbi:MAG TPA: type ISP restriction/modification enzyme [Pyrinomonadaceae bacterium]